MALPTQGTRYYPERSGGGRTRKDESSLLHYFRAAAPSRTAQTPGSTDLGLWLSLAQHWGLPTRLLDWSNALAVAAHFATSGPVDSGWDAAIWVLNTFRMNEHFGHEPLRYGIQSATAKHVVEPAFYYQSEEPGGYLGVMAVEHDPRVHAQQGAFTIHSSREPLENAERAEEWLHQIVIPANALNKVRLELRVLGVSRASLFPDLGSLAVQIRLDHEGIL